MADEQAAVVLSLQDGPKTDNAEETVDAEGVGEKPEPQATQEQGETQSGNPKRLGGWQRKLIKAEQERDHWKEEALRLHSSKPEPEKPKEPTETAKPKMEQFDSIEAYTEAIADWKAEQKLKAYQKQQEEKAQAEKQKAETETVVKGWRERAEAAREKHPDFDEAVEAVDELPFNPVVKEMIARSEQGAEVAYYLGTHTKEAKRIASLNPAQSLFEIGVIAARFAGKDTAEEKEPPQTKAPAPPKPVGKPTGSDQGLHDGLSYKEWVKRRNAQLRK